ncbi:MAG: Rrf2 family transcriptional regulator [Parcubacteria group bacterium]|nr:Rrf2 family transcriptional regulator [Parcubacteria group bacterium]
MIFSTRSTYGIRAMIYLAKKQGRGSVALTQISKDEKISLKYLERLFSRLKKAGLVKSEMGAAGGYKLAQSASKINIYDMTKALEGKLNPFHCSNKNKKIFCTNDCWCQAAKVLVKVEQAINATLKDIKLDQLL